MTETWFDCTCGCGGYMMDDGNDETIEERLTAPREIPVVSEELMKQVDSIFAHGGQRAKSHDLRFGQYLVNMVYKKTCSKAAHIPS